MAARILFMAAFFSSAAFIYTTLMTIHAHGAGYQLAQINGAPDTSKPGNLKPPADTLFHASCTEDRTCRNLSRPITYEQMERKMAADGYSITRWIHAPSINVDDEKKEAWLVFYTTPNHQVGTLTWIVYTGEGG